MARFRSIEGSRGVAAVEFAFVLVPLLAVGFGVTEFGRAMYEYNTVAKATRDAARYLSTHAAGATAIDSANNILTHTNATCIAVYGNKSCTGAKLLPQLNTSSVQICDALTTTAASCTGKSFQNVATGTGVVNLVSVTIAGYTFQSYVNGAIAGVTLGTPNITFSAMSTTMRQVN
jgi:Flp pilus assembly protein TadG